MTSSPEPLTKIEWLEEQYRHLLNILKDMCEIEKEQHLPMMEEANDANFTTATTINQMLETAIMLSEMAAESYGIDTSPIEADSILDRYSLP